MQKQIIKHGEEYVYKCPECKRIGKKIIKTGISYPVGQNFYKCKSCNCEWLI
jgi:hypothetical protein